MTAIARTGLAATLALLAAPSFAAGPDTTPAADPAPMPAAPMPAPRDPALVVTLGFGASVQPAYPGADDYRVGPTGSFAFHSLNVGRLSFGDPDPRAEQTGFGVRGSLRFVGERDSSEHDDIASLDDVDAAVELGLGVGYRTRSLDAFAVVRRGFGGHHGVVAEAGLDLIAQPTDALTLTAGPRLFWGDDEFSDTYFGVPAGNATATLPAYSASGGMVSAGLEFGASYAFNENWGLDTTLSYDRLTGDAADSPIVTNGSRDQWGLSVVLTRVIRLGF